MKRNFSNHNTHKPIIFSRQLFNKNFIHTDIFQTINNNNKTAIFQKQFSSAISAAVKLPNFQVSPRLNFCNECGVRGQNLLLSKNHKIAETFQYLFFFLFISLNSTHSKSRKMWVKGEWENRKFSSLICCYCFAIQPFIHLINNEIFFKSI